GRLLVHRDDPEPVGRLRVADPLELPVDEELALVRLDDAGQDLDESRLAGPVLADERVNRRGVDLEAHLVERLDAAVALGDAAKNPIASATSSGFTLTFRVVRLR